MFPGPPDLNPPLPGPHRAKTERFAQGALAAYLSAFPCATVVITALCAFNLDEEFDGQLLPCVVTAIMGIVGAGFAIMFICLAIFIPSVALAERLARGRHRRYLAEMIFSVFVAAIFCTVLRLLFGFVLKLKLTGLPLTPEQWQHEATTGLTYWAISVPFLLVFWWAAKGDQLGYGFRDLFKPRNIQDQIQRLFGRDASGVPAQGATSADPPA